MPSTVNVIDDGAFFKFNAYEDLKLTIPSTVKVIDDGAFNVCKLLERLIVPHEGLSNELEKLPFVHEASFECFSLSQFRIPQTVNSIASNAFTIGCRSLISIELPEESSFNIDLSGCRSLVNVVGQILTPVHREELFRSSKLGSFVDDVADLTRKLEHRTFDDSPLNKLCYYQSYHSSEGAMVQLHPPSTATTQKWMSLTPHLDMLPAVMDAGKQGHMVVDKALAALSVGKCSFVVSNDDVYYISSCCGWS
eukprot:scaffold1601_cov59-Cylindrotheca_fusiformis.AAC.2